MLFGLVPIRIASSITKLVTVYIKTFYARSPGSGRGNILGTPGGDFCSIGLNVHLDSTMN